MYIFSKPLSRRLLSCFLACGAFLVITLVGCDTPDQPKPPQPKPPQPKPLQIEQLPYADGSIRERLLSFDAMARRIAKPDWHHKPWYKVTDESEPNPWVAYRTMWSTHTDQEEFILTTETSSFHRFRFSAALDREDGKTVNVFSLHAIWFPGRGQWGASITYYAHPNSKDSYFIHFYPGKYRFDLDTLRTYEAGKRYGDYDYHFRVTVPRENVRAYLVSAKSFRDQGIASLDELKELVQKRIASGDALVCVTDKNKYETKIVGGTSSGDPPRKEIFPIKFRPPLPERYKLNPKQTKQIIEEAEVELNRRRKVLLEHYEAMYAATQKAFPLGKCLNLEP